MLFLYHTLTPIFLLSTSTVWLAVLFSSFLCRLFAHFDNLLSFNLVKVMIGVSAVRNLFWPCSKDFGILLISVAPNLSEAAQTYPTTNVDMFELVYT